jgi:uncharacterized membrane protein
MIDFNILKQKEEKGLVDYDVVDSMLVIKEKKYDEETGEEKNPETEFIDLKELLIKRKLYQDEIDKIDEILNKVKTKNKKIISLLTKQIYG